MRRAVVRFSARGGAPQRAAGARNARRSAATWYRVTQPVRLNARARTVERLAPWHGCHPFLRRAGAIELGFADAQASGAAGIGDAERRFGGAGRVRAVVERANGHTDPRCRQADVRRRAVTVEHALGAQSRTSDRRWFRFAAQGIRGRRRRRAAAGAREPQDARTSDRAPQMAKHGDDRQRYLLGFISVTMTGWPISP